MAESYGTRPLTSACGKKRHPDGLHLAYGRPLQDCWEGSSPSNVRTLPAYNRQPKGGDARVHSTAYDLTKIRDRV
jgi:hypothetical protein